MGWQPSRLLAKEFLILSTLGGIRAPDGTPIALGYHTGHLEVGLADAGRRRGVRPPGRRCPSPATVSDPCDGRTQGTTGMLDSLAYRNDAAMVLRRLVRSLPTAARGDGRGHLRQGAAGDDDGRWPRMHELPCVLVPGGVTLLPERRRRRRQGAVDRRALRPRADHAGRGRGAGLPRLRLARRGLPVPGHGRHRAGGRRSAGADRAALGAGALRAADLARHGPPLGPGPGAHGSRAGMTAGRRADRRTRSTTRWWCTPRSAARPTCCCTCRRSPTPPGLPRPTVDDWAEVNRARAAAGGRAAQRPGRPPHRARLPGRRRARGDAAPARAGPAASWTR